MNRVFKHSGNLGDIIYSLPSVLALGGGDFYVSLDFRVKGGKCRVPSPRAMSDESVKDLIDFLKNVSYIHNCGVLKSQRVDCDLDLFRNYVSPYRHLSCAHLKALGLSFDLSKPWLENVNPLKKTDIIIQRSRRHLPLKNNFNWHVLKNYQKYCGFIGYQDEYDSFRKFTGLSMPKIDVSGISEMASVIKGSKFFIGNQSLGFALAEAMKHPRALEVYEQKPNCLPLSLNGHVNISANKINYYLRDADNNEIDRSLLHKRYFLVALRNSMVHSRAIFRRIISR